MIEPTPYIINFTVSSGPLSKENYTESENWENLFETLTSWMLNLNSSAVFNSYFEPPVPKLN